MDKNGRAWTQYWRRIMDEKEKSLLENDCNNFINLEICTRSKKQ